MSRWKVTKRPVYRNGQRRWVWVVEGNQRNGFTGNWAPVSAGEVRGALSFVNAHLAPSMPELSVVASP